MARATVRGSRHISLDSCHHGRTGVPSVACCRCRCRSSTPRWNMTRQAAGRRRVGGLRRSGLESTSVPSLLGHHVDDRVTVCRPGRRSPGGHAAPRGVAPVDTWLAGSSSGIGVRLANTACSVATSASEQAAASARSRRRRPGADPRFAATAIAICIGDQTRHEDDHGDGPARCPAGRPVRVCQPHSADDGSTAGIPNMKPDTPPESK